LAMAAAAHWRRLSLPSEDRLAIHFRKNMSLLKQEILTEEKSRLDKALTIILVITIMLSIAALVYVIVTPKQGEKFTEFYILGSGGKAYDYPTRVQAGNKSTVIVGVVDHEYALVNYSLQMNLNNTTILRRNLTLQQNQTWQEPVSYVLTKIGDQQKLEFFLYKDGNLTAPYRDLHLWVNVTESRPLAKNTIEQTTVAGRN